MALEPEGIAPDFATAVIAADSRMPVAVNARSGVEFQAGLGPHSESRAIQLIVDELSARYPERYGEYGLSVPYPGTARQRCDWCIGTPPLWLWAIEVKLVRLLGDNGKLNDNMIMHLLSPYAAHRSALTDCAKLAASSLGTRKAILIYGFESAEWPLEPLISAFESLARDVVHLGQRSESGFDMLVHPVHRRGAVYVWEVFQ
jgi:hypothetical protein